MKVGSLAVQAGDTSYSFSDSRNISRAFDRSISCLPISFAKNPSVGRHARVRGDEFSAFVHEIGPEKREVLTENLRGSISTSKPGVQEPIRSGWKQLEIQETYRGKTVITEARHINDGMLRFMAILAELQSDIRFLLFDEIENGINPNWSSSSSMHLSVHSRSRHDSQPNDLELPG